MSAAKDRPPRLGRGLSSLLKAPVVATAPPVDQPADAPPGEAKPRTDGSSGETVLVLDVGRVIANRHQPRQHFDESSLAGLAESLKRDGVMQPVIVRPAAGRSEHYELVAGERRWRAAKLAGLTAIPALVRDLDDRQLAEWALIENLQREDLNPIERAEAFQHLIDQFKLTHDDIAQQVGVDRSTISNSLRLLNLQDDVRNLVRQDLLSSGQAKALAGLSDGDAQLKLADRAIRQGWSVRKLEEAVRAAAASAELSPDPEKKTTQAAKRPAHLADLEKQIGDALQTKVRIRPGRKKGAGSLHIDFYDLDQFDALLSRMGVEME